MSVFTKHESGARRVARGPWVAGTVFAFGVASFVSLVWLGAAAPPRAVVVVAPAAPAAPAAAEGVAARGARRHAPTASRILEARAVAAASDAFAPVAAPSGYALPSVAGVAATIDARGASITLRGEAIRLRARAVGRAADVAVLDEGASPRVTGQIVTVGRGEGVDEWYRALPSGLEHGVTLSARPAGEGPLRVEMAFDAPVSVDAHGDALVHGADGVTIARYADVWVTDATGRTLDAHLEVARDGVAVSVDDSRAVYPVVVDPTLSAYEWWSSLSGGQPYEQFGAAVAMSPDHQRIAVGAPRRAEPLSMVAGAGSVSVYVRGATGFTLEQELVSPSPVPDTFGNFGHAVVFGADGATLYVGAPVSNDSATSPSVFGCGAVHVFTRSGATWSETSRVVAADATQNDLFGRVVALSGDGTRLAVAAWSAIVSGQPAGAVYVFRVEAGGLVEEQRIPAPNPVPGARFGVALALDLTGNRLVVGAPSEFDESAYVFVRSGTAWTEEARFPSAAPTSLQAFGSSVAIDDAGSLVAVGAPQAPLSGPGVDRTGHVTTFARVGTTWSTRDTAFFGPQGVHAFVIQFGHSLAMTGDGARLFVGARFVASESSHGYGAVFEYGSVSSRFAYADDHVASSPTTSYGLGAALALRDDGTELVAGADNQSGEGAGAVRGGSVFVFSFRQNGQPCATDDQCASGACGAEGVCCDVACGYGTARPCGTCRSGGAVGVCNALTASMASGIACRLAAGACDVTEFCTGATGFDCPADVLAPTTQECRAAVAGGCDVAEFCDGVAPACPGDAKQPTSHVCRAATQPCDVQETCDGATDACPADAVRPVNTVCRAAAGACDIAEVCDGTNKTCAGDLVVGDGIVCRPATAACDVAEQCDGLATQCPSDAFATQGTSCRASTGLCDLAEVCPGTAASCPGDAFTVDGTPCDDGLSCTQQSACQTGVCAASVQLDCSDGDPCTTDVCTEPTGCAHVAVPACVVDAGVDVGVDVGLQPDSGADAGAPPAVAASGCGCRVAREPGDGPVRGYVGLVAAVAWVAARRRAARAARAPASARRS